MVRKKNCGKWGLEKFVESLVVLEVVDLMGIATLMGIGLYEDEEPEVKDRGDSGNEVEENGYSAAAPKKNGDGATHRTPKSGEVILTEMIQKFNSYGRIRRKNLMVVIDALVEDAERRKKREELKANG